MKYQGGFGGVVWYQYTYKHHINGENTVEISYNSKLTKFTLNPMTFRMTVKLWNTPAIVSRDADQTDTNESGNGSSCNLLESWCFTCFCSVRHKSGRKAMLSNEHLTDTAMLISELTRFDSFYIFFHRTPRVFRMLADRQSSDCLDTVLSVLKFILNIGCL